MRGLHPRIPAHLQSIRAAACDGPERPRVRFNCTIIKRSASLPVQGRQDIEFCLLAQRRARHYSRSAWRIGRRKSSRKGLVVQRTVKGFWCLVPSVPRCSQGEKSHKSTQPHSDALRWQPHAPKIDGVAGRVLSGDLPGAQARDGCCALPKPRRAVDLATPQLRPRSALLYRPCEISLDCLCGVCPCPRVRSALAAGNKLARVPATRLSAEGSTAAIACALLTRSAAWYFCRRVGSPRGHPDRRNTARLVAKCSVGKQRRARPGGRACVREEPPCVGSARGCSGVLCSSPTARPAAKA
jgi:hypothetical protein